MINHTTPPRKLDDAMAWPSGLTIPGSSHENTSTDPDENDAKIFDICVSYVA